MSPAPADAAEVYDAFAAILQSYDRGDDGEQMLARLLEDDTGLAARWADVVEGLSSSLQSSSSSAPPPSPLLLTSLSLEALSLRLLSSLSASRITPLPPLPSPESLLARNPYTPPLTLVQHILSSDPELEEMRAVVRLLEEHRAVGEAEGVVERREGGWIATKAALKRAKTGGAKSHALVESLDVDAPIRPKGVRGGGELAAEDSNHTLSLLPAMFYLLRHGRADECAELCRANDQGWRGAALLGGAGGWWVGGLDVKGDDDDDEMITEDVVDVEAGNRTRALWKRIGRAAATNMRLPVYERALYGVLTGYLPAVLPVCRTWEDHLWARLTCRIESRVDRRLNQLGGFWAEEFGVPDVSEDREAGLREIFKEVMAVERDGVSDKAKDPYRMAIMHIMLDLTDDLFYQFADSLPSLQAAVDPALYPPLIRFFAHLVLYLRLVGKNPPIEPARDILQAYLDVLEREGKGELVAVYAGSLGERKGEESYARFLRDLDPNTSKEERRLALERAKEHGLDLVEVAKLTVQLQMTATFLSLPGSDEPEPDITSFATSVVEGGDDWRLIRALEWLTVSDETFSEALIQANSLTRYFLASGKIHAARELLVQLPRQLLDFSTSDEASQGDLATHASEYVQLVMLFEVVGSLTKCLEIGASRPKSSGPKIDQLDWAKRLSAAVNKSYASTVDLLQSDWLKFESDESSLLDERRLVELARIRHIFVPELVFRLHHLLCDTSEFIAGNLQRALELPVIIADERYKLYVEFIQLPGSITPSRLPSYLDLVRQTSLACVQDAPEGTLPAHFVGQDPFTAPAAEVASTRSFLLA